MTRQPILPSSLTYDKPALPARTSAGFFFSQVAQRLEVLVTEHGVVIEGDFAVQGNHAIVFVITSGLISTSEQS